MSEEDQVRWGQQFAEEGSIAFPASRANMSLALLISLALSAAGVWMIRQGDMVPAVIGWAAIAFFGVVGVPGLSWRWITRKPIVRIDRDGVSSGERRALWSDIEGFWVWSMNGSAGVIVQLTPEAASTIRAHAHPVRRWWDGINERIIGPATMSLPVGNGFDPEAMAAWLNALHGSITGRRFRGLPEPPGGPSAEAEAPCVPDWPRAAIRPAAPPDPDTGFEAESAPPSVVGVLQWTSGVLLDGGSGPGGWDFIDLHDWAAGDSSGVITSLGDQDTDSEDLEAAVADELGHRVSLAPSTWVFSREDAQSWWTAPLLVVHRST